VGAWRVRGIRGQGSYGAVYRATSQEHAHAGPVALKLAINPGDSRFEREAELLSRIRHPSVPRLLDSGVWRSPWGGAHPFIVMEWVEGEPLYTWASRRNPSSHQVLVRHVDSRLFLADFGAGFFSGTARMTPPRQPVGTPEYRSPELWESTRYTGDKATSAAMARPADDVFALGVTAYRLVTDTYPPLPLPDMKACQCWLPGGSGPPPPRQLNPRVDAQLNALILRMLSLNPEDRGSALELTEAMERGVAHAGPSADEPLFEWETLPPPRWTEEELAEAEYLGHRPRHRDREWVRRFAQADAGRAQPLATRPAGKSSARRWLTWLAAAMALGLWSAETSTLRTQEQLTKERAVSLGDAALSTQPEHEKAPTEEPIAQEMPSEPLPRQRRPDSKGHCPTPQVAINGGCWRKVDVPPEDCHGNVHPYQGACYLPMFTRGRVPAAAPPER
jgi:serine/threonine protein kinase